MFHLFFARNQRYSKKDRLIGNADLQLIDMGIAMRHFEAMTQARGLCGAWVVLKTIRTANVPEGVDYFVSWQKH